MADSDILQANESFSAVLKDGSRFSAEKGRTRIRANHPAVKQNPQYFEPIDVHYDVEQATRAPGEKRARTRKTTAKATAKAATAKAPAEKPVEAATAAPGETRP